MKIRALPAPAVLIAFCLLALPVAQPAQAKEPAGPTVLMGDACVPPRAPEVPVGADAQTLAAAAKDVRAYVKLGEDYIVCLTRLDESWSKSKEPVPEEKRKQLIANHNRMVDEMHAVADRFNAEVRRLKGEP